MEPVRAVLGPLTDGVFAATPVDGTETNDTAGAGTEPGVVIEALLPSWLPSWVPDMVASIAVLVLAYVVSRVAVRLLGRRLARRFDRPSLTRTALSSIRALIYLWGLLVVLRINGLDLGNIALSITVLSAVVGVILAPIVGSVISGVFLLADQPYEIGDMIQLDEAGTRGYVEDITLRYTKIFTLENTFLVIPNGTIRDRDVYNFSAEDPRTRLSLDVLVTYESDVPRARELLEDAAAPVQGVVEGGPSIRVGSARYPSSPTCHIEEFGDHGVLLTLRFWVREPYRIPAVRSTVQANVWEAFEEDGVEFAYPHAHLIFDETSGELGLDHNGGSGPPPGTRRPTVRGGRSRHADRHTASDGPPSESGADSTDEQ